VNRIINDPSILSLLLNRAAGGVNPNEPDNDMSPTTSSSSSSASEDKAER